MRRTAPRRAASATCGRDASPIGVLGVRDGGPVRLTWRCRAATIRTRRSERTRSRSARDAGASRAGRDDRARSRGDAQVASSPRAAALRSREVRYYRVRVRVDRRAGRRGATRSRRGRPAGASDWLGRGRSPCRTTRAPISQSPAPLLRRSSFDVDGSVRRARLLRDGARSAPGTDQRATPSPTTCWRPAGRRTASGCSPTPTTSPTCCVPGENVIGGGPRRRLVSRAPRLGPDDDRARYGSEIGAASPSSSSTLEDGTRRSIATDGAWRASTGEIRSADLYDGCVHRPARDGKPAGTGRVRRPRLGPGRACVPLDSHGHRATDGAAGPGRSPSCPPTAHGPGRRLTRLDGGQNIAGCVRLRVRGPPGSTVTVRHAEVLEPDGSLHTRSLRSAKATDTYVLADDADAVLEPAFTFHGFRYAEVDDATPSSSTRRSSPSAATRRADHFDLLGRRS